MGRSTFFRHFRFVNACLFVLAVGGCIKIGGSDNDGNDESGDCESDSECDDDEICEGGECQPIGSGGTNAGGASTGGRSGSASGGASTGGASSGGASRGGTSSGGASTGGASTGGAGGGPTDTCGTYCDFSLRCGGEAIGECLATCDEVYVVGGACASAMEGLSTCIRAYGPDCATIGSACETQGQGVITACGDGTCPADFLNDGECDEPEGTGLCPEGTDAADCTGCGYTLDGDCDEPEGLGVCDEGTDVVDCACPEDGPGNTCTWNCDAVCDEPDFCETGTDVYDCANYPQ